MCQISRRIDDKLITPERRREVTKLTSRIFIPEDETTIAGFPLAWFLPTVSRDGKSRSLQYINYQGSLTTPPCSEIVDWIVITGRTLQINEKAVSRKLFFLYLYDHFLFKAMFYDKCRNCLFYLCEGPL